jgi:hypothetical protein
MKTDVSIPTLKMLKGLSEESTIADLKDSLRVAGYDVDATLVQFRLITLFGVLRRALKAPALVAELQKKQKEEKRHPGIYTRWFSVTVYMHPTFYVSWFFPKLIRGGWWPSVEFAYRRMRS